MRHTKFDISCFVRHCIFTSSRGFYSDIISFVRDSRIFPKNDFCEGTCVCVCMFLSACFSIHCISSATAIIPKRILLAKHNFMTAISCLSNSLIISMHYFLSPIFTTSSIFFVKQFHSHSSTNILYSGSIYLVKKSKKFRLFNN